MLKSDLIKVLQKSIDDHGDGEAFDNVEIFDSGCHAIYRERKVEHEGREKIVRNIIRAKREAGYRVSCNFFEDVWPKARDALLKEKGGV